VLIQLLPSSLKNLIDQLSKLPEIGPRAATRLAFFILNQPEAYSKELAKAVLELKSKTRICSQCFNLTSSERCDICSSPKREQNTICVVEDSLDILPFEKTRRYQGTYHVLGGLIAPTDGIMPENLRIKELVERVKNLKKNAGPSFVNNCEAITAKRLDIEIIIALNPTTEGDTTALYLERTLKPLEIKITRLGRGLSTGSDLEYTDETTLINALQNRR
jgi:recombination protein RecR